MPAVGPRYCTVAVDSPVFALDRPFDYRIPDRMTGRVRVGSVVRVLLHGRRMRAFVVAVHDQPAVASPAPLSGLVGEEPLFTGESISLARWVARRYLATLGAVLHAAVPGRFSAPAAPSRPRAEAEPVRAPVWIGPPDALRSAIRAGRTTVVVAPDIGSELDVVAHAAALAAGNVLVVCPRTAVAQEAGRRLPSAVVAHADQSPARRSAAWSAARDGAARILVATRAAVLAPLPDVGLVCVIGAHDRSLKEERSPRLHALVVAQRRAESSGAALLITSPAPPLDLFGPGGVTTWIEPKPDSRPRPEVVAPRPGPVTARLLDAVRAAIGEGRDALVFTGRKGLVLRVRCEECGWFPSCDRCGTGLALFAGGGRRTLRCRACGAGRTVPNRCADCGGARLDGVGWGSERLEAALAGERLPVVRVDAERPLPDDRPRPAVVVGTQALTGAFLGKRAGCVCVADLDQLLGVPDFRAAERAFQTLAELAALLEPGGRFVVQTREPEHAVVQAFTRGSFRYFAQRELPRRRAAGYPPFGALVHVALDPADAPELASAVRVAGGEVIGPLVRPDGSGAALVRAPLIDPLLDPLREFASRHANARIDVDPVDLG